MPTGLTVGVAGIALVAALCDLRTRRVPNLVTFGAAAAGVGYAILHGGAHGLQASLLGWLVGLALFFPFFAVGGMGAGDVKLLAAFGAWLGPVGALWTAICGSLVGGVLAIIAGLCRGYLSEALRNVAAMLAMWRTLGPGPLPGLTLEESKGPRLAYAVPIGIGAVLVVWLGYV